MEATWDDYSVTLKNVKLRIKHNYASPSFLYFVCLTTINSFLIRVLNPTFSLWPQIDNLSGLQAIGSGNIHDFYTISTLRSPRIFSILIFKAFSVLTRLSAPSTIALIGALIAVIGLPLFVMSVKKRFVIDTKYQIKMKEILAIGCFFTFLNSNVIHQIEVNGFYTNPFIQGATTSNICMIIFFIGYLNKNHKVNYLFSALSLLIHLTTAIFLILIFFSFTKWMEFNIKTKRVLFLLIVTILTGTVTIAWFYPEKTQFAQYYVHYRAQNHFEISSDHIFWLFTILLLLFLAQNIFKLYIKNRYFDVLIYITLGTAIAFLAYPMYFLPFLLSSVVLLLIEKTKVISQPIQVLLLLFLLQSFPLDPLSSLFSLFIPATRFVSMLSLFLMTILVLHAIGFHKKLSKGRYKFTRGAKLRSILISVLLGISLLNIKNSFQELQTQIRYLKITVLDNGINFNKKDLKLLPIEVDTLGWREFRKANIYIDEYPFWGNLDEFRIRSNFQAEARELIDKNQFTKIAAIMLLRKYEIQDQITLVAPLKIKNNLRQLNCHIREEYILCNLQDSK